MYRFRHNFDLGQAIPRETQPEDTGTITRLLRQSVHRCVNVTNSELHELLISGMGMALTIGADVLAVAITGRPVEATAWLQVLVLADGLAPRPGLVALLPPLHALLRTRGIHQLYYSSDSAADTWLPELLHAQGYHEHTEVIVYEKQGFGTPDAGNRSVSVLRAQAPDLPQILALDRACFEPQWVKEEGAIGPALIEVPFFLVAELAGRLVGYAFATTHFGGRLVHLVRIAVAPALRGQAIGVRLLAELAAFAQRSGAEAITLNTQRENYGAQRLYEWFGFQRTGERQKVLCREL